MRGTLTRLLCAAAIFGGLFVSGCKQGEGDRCEVDSDCSGGLVCSFSLNRANGVCSPTRTVVLDGAAVDGSGLDGIAADLSLTSDVNVSSDAPISSDAAPDATSDAPRDASPEVAASDGGSSN
jgi:hypothetical protein